MFLDDLIQFELNILRPEILSGAQLKVG